MHCNPVKKFIAFFGILCGLSMSSVYTAEPVVDSLFTKDGNLVLSYHLEPILDEQTINSLKHGAITTLSHHVQLWKDRSFVNSMVREYVYPIQISYDNWEHKYRIQVPGEERLTLNLETIREKCTQMQQLILVSLADLEPEAEYCITIRVKFAPLSIDTYDAIRGVLPESKDTEQKQTGGSIWRLALNLLGLGDKTYSFKTKNFMITAEDSIEYVKK